MFWVLISEIYPQRLRGTATGVTTFFEWGENLLVSLTFLSILQRFGRTVGFWGLGIISFAAFVYTYFRVPETMGRSLESIETDLRQSALGNVDADVDADADRAG